MTYQRPVAIELHHEISQFLVREAWMFDGEELRDWLTQMVDPAIRYQMVVADERFNKDKTPQSAREVPLFDDDYAILDMRVRQYETGLQPMLDPKQTMFRVISNIMAVHGENEGEFIVRSVGTASRFRRAYESERMVYARRDILKRDDTGQLRLFHRRVDLGERVIRSKNLLFFL